MFDRKELYDMIDSLLITPGMKLIIVSAAEKPNILDRLKVWKKCLVGDIHGNLKYDVHSKPIPKCLEGSAASRLTESPDSNLLLARAQSYTLCWCS